MPTETAIAWCDYSSNPIKYRDRETGKTVWACVKKSAGCTNCYSEALALRWNKGLAFARPNIDKVEPFFDEKEAARLLNERVIPSGSRVFVGDMTDVFGSWLSEGMISRLFALFARRNDVTFQVLTKRPERASKLLNGASFAGIADEIGGCPWPLPNVWLGTSCENQDAADQRIPHLLRTPAAVRFLSCEPLLGPVDLTMVKLGKEAGQLGQFDQYIDAVKPAHVDGMGFERRLKHGVGWVIVGGESGPKHRQMTPSWLTSIVDQCRKAGVAAFTKQDSGMYPGRRGRIPDAYWQHQFPEPRVPAEPGARGGGRP